MPKQHASLTLVGGNPLLDRGEFERRRAASDNPDLLDCYWEASQQFLNEPAAPASAAIGGGFRAGRVAGLLLAAAVALVVLSLSLMPDGGFERRDDPTLVTDGGKVVLEEAGAPSPKGARVGSTAWRSKQKHEVVRLMSSLVRMRSGSPERARAATDLAELIDTVRGVSPEWHAPYRWSGSLEFALRSTGGLLPGSPDYLDSARKELLMYDQSLNLNLKQDYRDCRSYAICMNNMAYPLLHLDRFDEALMAARVGLREFRVLAEARPDDERAWTSMANSLDTLADMLEARQVRRNDEVEVRELERIREVLQSFAMTGDATVLLKYFSSQASMLGETEKSIPSALPRMPFSSNNS